METPSVQAACGGTAACVAVVGLRWRPDGVETPVLHDAAHGRQQLSADACRLPCLTASVSFGNVAGPCAQPVVHRLAVVRLVWRMIWELWRGYLRLLRHARVPVWESWKRRGGAAMVSGQWQWHRGCAFFRGVRLAVGGAQGCVLAVAQEESNVRRVGCIAHFKVSSCAWQSQILLLLDPRLHQNQISHPQKCRSRA